MENNSTCNWQTIPSFPCGKPATAFWEYGRGGPVLAVCQEHDRQMAAELASNKCRMKGHEKGCPKEELKEIRDFVRRLKK